MMYRANWRLLLLPAGILLLGTGVLELKQYPHLQTDFLPWLAAVIIASFLVQFFLQRRLPGSDGLLFPLVMFFSSMGLMMIARLKPVLFIPQLRWLLIGMLVFCLVVFFAKQIRPWLHYQYLLGVTCILLLLLPLVLGTEIGGSRNWLVFGPFQVQPSEFSKILIVMFLSSYLADHRNLLTLPSRKFLFLELPPLRFIAPLLLIWSMALLMFVVAKDLGSALLFFGIAILMTYMATGRKSYIFLAMVFFSAASAFSYFLFAHVRVRFAIWLHPWADPNGQAYQIVQSLFAFGAGGVWGTGFAHGHPGFIPEVHTDFIFSAIGEEFGLLGVILIMIGYAILFYRSILIALACQADQQKLLAAGCGIVFFLQAFIIIAGVTKFLPLTGVTLPFISYGGSSMVSGFILLGLLAALSKKENGHA
jgi:cell division protein FtsW (lipid II flippase)